MRRVAGVVAALAGLSAVALPAAPAGRAAGGSDQYCTGTYGTAAPRPAARIRLGVDPGLAGSVGGQQLPSSPDDPSKDLTALHALRPPGHVLVLRLNRLFWSDGSAAVQQFRRQALGYSRAGFQVEIQVRYHPGSGEEGDLAAWTKYVRGVVDSLGPVPGVIAMTITNEVNLNFSPNTSDGYYSGAPDALIQGIEAAHAEAVRRRLRKLAFGFTYAYRFSPSGDASFFAYLGAHGGAAFRRALGFVGLDFYPGTVYPPAMTPTDSYRAELAQAAGVLRSCFMPMAGLGAGIPIWITENGIPTGALSEAQQAAALAELVQATRDYARTFNITDYRWFNLRDAQSTGPETVIGPTFASFGLLRDDYSRKASFATYRSLIAALGTLTPRVKPTRHRHRARKRHPTSRKRPRQPVARRSG